MSDTNKILVTGSTGFVGRRLCDHLRENGFSVREAVRHTPTAAFEREFVNVGEINGQTDWRRAVDGVHGVIHLAGRAHILREDQADPFSAYRLVNVEGTARLAKQAAAAGIRRLVFVSSIGVNGSSTVDKPFTELDTPHPHNPYSMTKYMAEVELERISQETGMEIVAVRPPLVYGPGVKGNFLTLLRLVYRGLPLPLARCDNRRSLIGLENLVDLLRQCVTQPSAAGQTFLAGEGQDLSTPELIRRLASALGRKPRLLPVPVRWLQFAARMAGRPNDYERLCGSLQVDIRHTQQVLGWTPPFSMEEELARTAAWFKKRSKRA